MRSKMQGCCKGRRGVAGAKSGFAISGGVGGEHIFSFAERPRSIGAGVLAAGFGLHPVAEVNMSG